MDAAHAAVDGGIEFGNLGTPGFDRRLTDKILAAFNHAYAVGDIAVARRLHAVLALAEDHERGRLLAGPGIERRDSGAIDQADLWVAYVEARNSFQAVCEPGQPETDETRAAFEAMKRAYRRWSDG